VREIIEFVLAACGAWDKVTTKYFDAGAEG
jgi:hypothetical protein